MPSRRLDLSRALRLLHGDSEDRVAPATLRRLRTACRAGGVAALEALVPERLPERQLMGFFAARVAEWLEIERDRVGVAKVTWRGSRIDIFGRRARYQLRFAPDRCGWLLLRLRPSGWIPHLPDRACLSLVDWLCELRRWETSLLQEEPGHKRSEQAGICWDFSVRKT